MDQKKIGRFIAERRKAKSLTQVALGERLGVSNKAVSKWERGICLPDVSLYQDLCMVLGISLNEFFAGEFIEKENIEMTSENNLISLSASGSSKKKKFVRIITVLSIVLCISLIAVAVFAKNAYDGGVESEIIEEAAEEALPLYHSIETWDLTDREQILLGMVQDEDLDLNLFRYNTGSSFAGGFSVEMTVYQNGEKVTGQTVYEMEFWEKCRHYGEIAITTDWEDPSVFAVKATVNGGPGKNGTAEVDLTKYLDDGWFDEAEGGQILRDDVEMLRSQLHTEDLEESESGKLRIVDGTAIPLVMYGWNHGGNGSIPGIDQTLDGEVSCDADVAVIFTVTFHKEL